MHIENRKGTAQQAADYCKKEGNIFEKGQISKPGKRTDLQNTKELVLEGASMREIVTVATNYQSVRMAEKMLSYLEKKRNWVPQVYWFHGSTGSGKTRAAFEQCEEPWVSAGDLRWWDGYDAHEDIILDDFRGDFCKFHTLLRILDRYEYRIEIKGGFRQLLAKRIFITSPYHPTDVYKNITDEDVQQLLRRITEIRLFGNPVQKLLTDAFQDIE